MPRGELGLYFARRYSGAFIGCCFETGSHVASADCSTLMRTDLKFLTLLHPFGFQACDTVPRTCAAGHQNPGFVRGRQILYQLTLPPA